MFVKTPDNQALHKYWIVLKGSLAEEAGVEPTKPVLNRLHRV